MSSTLPVTAFVLFFIETSSEDESWLGLSSQPVSANEQSAMTADDKKAAVLDAVRDLKCLREPGSGIAFTIGVDDFTLLGKKNA